MRKHDHNIFANAASLLICGILAGIVVAAAAFPAIAMGGLAAKAGADTFGELPSELNVPTPPQITYLYASDAKTLLGTFYDENRHEIPLADIPQVMRDAILAAEDERFYDHNGVDVQGIVRAFVANQQSDSTQGASTLTMQYVRQAITYSATSPAEVIAATEQTNARKLREARLALALETVLTKDQILERYLNIAAFGHGAYGIYAASQVYFDKEPKDLALEEAALLAAMPKAPSAFDPESETGRPQALARRNYILGQMAELGMVTPAEAEAAKSTKIEITGTRTPNGCVSTIVNHWGFYCDFFYRWWLEQEEFGRDPAEREGRLRSGGYTIVTTLDVKIQESAKKNLERELKTGSRDALMVAAIEPGTGYVKAMAANRTYGLDTSNNKISTDPRKAKKKVKGTFPTTTNPIISGGGDISGYKAGSTFKIFTMLAALEAGYPLDFTIVARSPYRSPVYIVGTNDISVCSDKVHWCPQNANGAYMNGPRTMWSGFGRSVNTYFVPLQEKVGADKVIAMAERLGIQFRNSVDKEFTAKDRRKYFGPFTIGVTDTVPLELANAYATVAAEGKYCEPMPVLKITDVKGQEITEVAKPRCEQVVDKEVARAAAEAARCPLGDQGLLRKCDGGTMGSYFTDLKKRQFRSARQAVGHPVIGKTGTSDFNWTANLVISTRQLTVAATLADPDFAQQPHNDEAPRKANRAAVHTLRDAMAGLEKIDFLKPPQRLIYGKRVAIPVVECRTVAQAKSRVESAGFDVIVEQKPINSNCPAGTVAKTDPTGYVSKGSTITLLISNGEGGGGEPGDGGGGDGGDGGPGGGGGGGPGGGGGG